MHNVKIRRDFGKFPTCQNFGKFPRKFLQLHIDPGKLKNNAMSKAEGVWEVPTLPAFWEVPKEVPGSFWEIGISHLHCTGGILKTP